MFSFSIEIDLVVVVNLFSIEYMGFERVSNLLQVLWLFVCGVFGLGVVFPWNFFFMSCCFSLFSLNSCHNMKWVRAPFH